MRKETAENEKLLIENLQKIVLNFQKKLVRTSFRFFILHIIVVSLWIFLFFINTREEYLLFIHGLWLPIIILFAPYLINFITWRNNKKLLEKIKKYQEENYE